ncbi:MAG: manganese catalase family protein, partial [Clostridiaceae bacterium]
MFKHEKPFLNQLQVKVERPNPQYAVLMQEQLGGGNGELKAALQYLSQRFRVKDQTIKDLFLDIGTEELSHMEIVAETINLLNGHDVNYETVGTGE